MTENRLRKFVSKGVDYKDCQFSLPGYLSRQPIVVSDSKGFCLNRANTLTVPKIEFVCKSGCTTKEGIDLLLSKLGRATNVFRKAIVYVWLGTCDLTVKEGKFIRVRQWGDDVVNDIVNQYERAKTFVSTLHDTQIVFVEIPPVCVSKWNGLKGHANADTFVSHDKEITRQVELLNEHIVNMNNVSGMFTVRFTKDIMQSRGSKSKNVKTRMSYKMSLLHDGVHPGNLLSEAWMMRLHHSFVRVNMLHEDVLDIMADEEEVQEIL